MKKISHRRNLKQLPLFHSKVGTFIWHGFSLSFFKSELMRKMFYGNWFDVANRSLKSLGAAVQSWLQKLLQNIPMRLCETLTKCRIQMFMLLLTHFVWISLQKLWVIRQGNNFFSSLLSDFVDCVWITASVIYSYSLLLWAETPCVAPRCRGQTVSRFACGAFKFITSGDFS